MTNAQNFYIIYYIFEREKERVKPILQPTTCPSCDSMLERVNDLLYCYNKSCPAQWDKKLQHFATSLKIKGLGPATITKLQLESFQELYELTVAEIEQRLGSARLAEKLFQELNNSKNASLQTLLPAFAIPLFGRSASQKLCDSISHIEEITEKSCTEAGIGPKASMNILNWLEDEYYPQRLADTLPFSWTAEKVERKPTIGVVCITGKLKTYPTKAHAQEVLNRYGYVVKSSLTKDCTHLVNESGIESAKTQTARERGVLIINNVKELIEEN